MTGTDANHRGSESPIPPAGRARPRVLVGAMVVLAVSLCVNAFFFRTTRFITSEEHFRLGFQLRHTGILSINAEPAFFRPPGFPVFVAAVLGARDGLGLSLPDERAVLLAQGLLVGWCALGLYLYWVRNRPVIQAAALGCLFALHPVVLLIATNISYPTLHLILVIAATLTLASALRATRHRVPWALAAGVLWGAATLVRPTSLILPPFVFLLAHWEFGRSAWRRTLAFGALFTLGMSVIIAPYTWRNYRVTGRFIAVSAQAGYNLWGATVEEAQYFTDYPAWVPLWHAKGMPIFTATTGARKYSLDMLYAHALRLNDAFAAEARKNIAAHPGVYAGNVLRNMSRFNADTLAWWTYRYRSNYLDENPIYHTRIKLTEILTAVLIVLALLGEIHGLRRGDTLARTLAVVYAMFCIATSIMFTLERYNYVRLPLVLLALPLFLQRDRLFRPALRAARPGCDPAAPRAAVDLNTLCVLGLVVLAALAGLNDL